MRIIIITQSDGTIMVFPYQKIISDEVNIKISSGTLAEKLTAKEIKQQIKNWKGDYIRV
jgi:hypothetical protein